jgi:hypothetical protein
MEAFMARSKRKKRTARVILPQARHAAVEVSPERELAPVVCVGWEIRRGDKYFGVIQRADGTVERTRLERDDLKAAADFVTAHKLGKSASIRGRQVQRLT